MTAFRVLRILRKGWDMLSLTQAAGDTSSGRFHGYVGRTAVLQSSKAGLNISVDALSSLAPEAWDYEY